MSSYCAWRLAAYAETELDGKALQSRDIGEQQDEVKRMQQQPESLSSTLTVSPAPPPDPPSDAVADLAEPPHHVPRWLERVELFLRVMLRMYIGLAVCYAPWSHTFWDQNPIFQAYPTLSSFAASGAVRGLVSGLGLLNLWIAFQDAIRHRDS